MPDVREIFAHVGLEPQGPVPWGHEINEDRPGIYVVTVDIPAKVMEDHAEMKRLGLASTFGWSAGKNIVYIGRTQVSLRRRMRQFYKHTYGRSSPHRGGQEVLRLTASRSVYWARTPHPVEAERRMIEKFFDETRRLPFANKVRGWLRTLVELEQV